MQSESWTYRHEIGGNLAPIEDPTGDGSLTDALDRLGFVHSEDLGDPDGMHLQVYASKAVGHRWILIAGDGFSQCLIEVLGWPAFLDAMARYSPVFPAPVSN
jgi:hypothetical protein